MAELFQQLLEWVKANPDWAGMAVFATALVESLAIVGSIVPGVAILFAVGTMIGAGALDFWHMTALAAVGAVLGDGLSFWLGNKYQNQLTGMWPFKHHPAILEKGVSFFQKYGGKSVALGRFFGPVRAVIPMVAGMLNMPTSRFLVANFLSALVWAPAYLIPGTLFGASLDLASEVALRLALLLLLLLILLWFLGWLSHRVFSLFQPHAQNMLQRLVALGESNKLLSPVAGALADPKHPESRGLALLAGILMLAGILLVLLNLFPAQPLAALDASIQLARQAVASAGSDHVMLAIATLADKGTTLLALVAIWAILKLSHSPLAARHWLISFGIIWLVSLAAEFLMLNNPSLIRLLPDIYVLRGIGLYGMAAIICANAIPLIYRWVLYSGASILIFSIMLAQFYHGSAFSAVFQGLVLGLLWVAAVGIAYRTHSHHEPIRIKQAIYVGVLLLAMGISSILSAPTSTHLPDMRVLHTIEEEHWWREGWQKLPATRDDLKKIKHHPLNVQFSGDIKSLMNVLKNQNWQQVESGLTFDWLKMLSPNVTLNQLPALPHSHRGHYETYQFVKPADNYRWVLYFWPSRFVTSSGNTIWLGATGQQHKKQLGLLSYPVTDNNHALALEYLLQELQTSGFKFRIVDQERTLIVR